MLIIPPHFILFSNASQRLGTNQLIIYESLWNFKEQELYVVRNAVVAFSTYKHFKINSIFRDKPVLMNHLIKSF